MNDTAQSLGGDGSLSDTANLARQLHSSNPASFQQLYDRVAPTLYAWTRIRVRASPALTMDPQDVLQEVWLRAMLGFENYDPTRSFRAWILGIARNLLVESYRQASRDAAHARREHLLQRESAVPDIPDSVTSISMRLAKDEGIQLFLAHVDQLDSDDRMLVLYCGFEDFTCAEAATRLGLSPEVVTKRWQKLRSRLRESPFCRSLELT